MWCEWKISLKIGGLRCLKYFEKKPNLTILASLKFQIFFINHGSKHSTFFQKKNLALWSYLPQTVDSLALWKVIEMRPVLVSIKNAFLKAVNLSQLNYFLINSPLNIRKLVLSFKNFYVAEKITRIFKNWQSPLLHKNLFLTKLEQKGYKLAPK